MRRPRATHSDGRWEEAPPELPDEPVILVAQDLAPSDTAALDLDRVLGFCTAAGVPNGTMAPLDMSTVYLHNAQYTGTSGFTLEDQRMVLRKTLAGDLSPGRSVGANGGH